MHAWKGPPYIYLLEKMLAFLSHVYLSFPPPPPPPLSLQEVRSLFILPAHNRYFAVLKFLFQVLVHRKCHRLTGCYTHDTRCDTLVERMETLLPVPRISTSPHPHRPSKARHETHRNISRAIAVIRLNAVSPGIAGVFCSRVLMVSIGALLNGPIAPLINPMSVVW